MTRVSYLIIFLLLTVVSRAQVTITPSATETCAASAVSLEASGADVYTWVPSANLDTAAGDSVNFSTSTANTYTISVYGTDTTSDETDTVSIVITVHPKPTVTITSSAAAANDFICLGNSATLTAGGSGGIVSYSWTPAATLDSPSNPVVVATPTATTTYTLMVTDSNGCTGSQTKQVKVNPQPPSLVVTATDTTICPGQSTTITANGTGNSFSWSPAGSLNNPALQTVVATPTTSTTYTVTATANACFDVKTIHISVLTAPALSYTQSSGGAAICLDEEDEVTITCAECEYYIWKFPNASLQTTSSVQAVSPDEIGAIPVYVSGFGPNGCKTTATVIVNVDSCFVGTPFGVDEIDNHEINIVQKGPAVQVSSHDMIQSVLIYNLLGERVVSLVDPGKTAVAVNTADFPAGVYVVIAKTTATEASHKIYLH